MKRSFYSDSIANFLNTSIEEILGKLTIDNRFSLEQSQRDSWISEIKILKDILCPFKGFIYFEYIIPRMGQRIDVVLLIGPVIFVLEFKIGEKKYAAHAIDQVMDYALDLKNFHETSHERYIAPVLIATDAKYYPNSIATTPQNNKLFIPIRSNTETLRTIIEDVVKFCVDTDVDNTIWEKGRYNPTPTIIEAAIALYKNHSVEDISRSDAEAINLKETTDSISRIINYSREKSRKSICFVTGVPGAGKTLVGLKVANEHLDKSNELYSVFLSGNGPLVAILREALSRDKIQTERQNGIKIKKKDAEREIKSFIQNVHHFKDEYLLDDNPPPEHVALFDEAQRAWTLEQTSSFMRRKKDKPYFNQSEPEFLISCLDRYQDWATIVCLVGGGQEINTGEAGISEWIKAIDRSYPHWDIYVSPQLSDSEYDVEDLYKSLKDRSNVKFDNNLHLAVSIRSFRAENISLLVKQLLDLNINYAKEILEKVSPKYPIVITRDLLKAKQWVKQQALGSERYGIVVSSQAERLKPHAIFVKSSTDPVKWFLNGKEDTRSSYYLEDVATEFDVQGLELDWTCVVWDADFRFIENTWEHWSFIGSRWNKIKKEERKKYLKNAYRVLLTRARQGMVIVVPPGDLEDPTRPPSFYDPTFEYLKEIGFKVI